MEDFINKVIKRKKKRKKPISEFTHLHGNILTKILNYVTAVLIPYITVLSMITYQ